MVVNILFQHLINLRFKKNVVFWSLALICNYYRMLISSNKHSISAFYLYGGILWQAGQKNNGFRGNSLWAVKRNLLWFMAADVSEKLFWFAKALREYGWAPKGGTGVLSNWFDVFSALRDLISKAGADDRLIIFIDEMPWMDNKKSDFVPAFEHFWDGWTSWRKNIMLIVCGSETSWITKKIFRNKGGLYNRTTRQIALTE